MRECYVTDTIHLLKYSTSKSRCCVSMWHNFFCVINRMDDVSCTVNEISTHLYSSCHDFPINENC